MTPNPDWVGPSPVGRSRGEQSSWWSAPEVTKARAIFPYARDHLAYPEHLQEGLEPHKVREVYLWGSEEPDTFLDITDIFSTKMDALYCHASQMKRPREERESQRRAHYERIGKKIGVPLAEAFKRIDISR